MKWVFIVLIFFGLIKISDLIVLREIQSGRPHDALFDTRPLTQVEEREVQRALNQNYTYFGSGGQAYVFFSSDGKYAMKFFKQRHFREPRYLDYIPFIEKYRAKKYDKRRKKIEHEYGSYKISFDELKEETALVYVHLNKTSHLKKSLTFKDRFKLSHTIDLDKTDFILQKRAELVCDKIGQEMASGNREIACQTITSIVELITTFCKKGYHDRDPQISKNCGILEGRAIKIDVGRFLPNCKMKQPLFFKPALYRITRPFRQWLSQNHPELVPHLEKEVLRVIVHG